MMKMIYAALKNEDQTEGRGAFVAFAHFRYEEDAQLAVKGRGVMGVGDGRVEEIRVYDSFEEWKRLTDSDNIKRIALAKLTTEEKKVLGL